jgi:hypothetical protein
MKQVKYNVEIVMCVFKITLLGHAAADEFELFLCQGLQLPLPRHDVHILKVGCRLVLVRFIHYLGFCLFSHSSRWWSLLLLL